MSMKEKLSNCNNYGKLVILIGLLIACPLIVLPFYPEESKYALAFLAPSIISVMLGAALCLKLKPSQNNLQRLLTLQYGYLTVLFAWFYGFLAGAIPFVFSGQLNFVQALFESVSGWTTTGLSVVDVTVLPHIFLFHRSYMQFLGGLGFVMIMIMFVQGKQSMSLYSAEGHPDKLMPNLKNTARTIILMYLYYLLFGTIGYVIFGMNTFDSLLHAMSALSTGGFSTKVDSIGAYNNLSIEVLTIVLMLIGTTNFAVLLMITKRRFKKIKRVSEIRFMILIIIIFVPILSLSLFNGIYSNFPESIRVSLFNIISALSTTGYSTVTYATWPEFSIGILILLMLIGGGSGSTAGGIKLTRVYLLFRISIENIRKRIHPSRRVMQPFYYKAQGKTPIDEELSSDITGFISSYLFLFILGSMLLTITTNSTLTEAMFEFASSLGTVGLSIGITGPATTSITLIIQMIGMTLGRLEIFIVLIGFYSGVSLFRNKLKKHKLFMN